MTRTKRCASGLPRASKVLVQRDAVHARHAEVAQDEVVLGLLADRVADLFLEEPRGLASARHDLDGDVPPCLEGSEVGDHHPQRLGQEPIIVNDQDSPRPRTHHGPDATPRRPVCRG